MKRNGNKNEALRVLPKKNKKKDGGKNIKKNWWKDM